MAELEQVLPLILEQVCSSGRVRAWVARSSEGVGGFSMSITLWSRESCSAKICGVDRSEQRIRFAHFPTTACIRTNTLYTRLEEQDKPELPWFVLQEHSQ